MVLTLPVPLLWMYFCIPNMVVEPFLSCSCLKAKDCEVMSFHPPHVEKKKNSNNNSLNIIDNNII